MKILITGGHFTPAIALIEELKKDYKLVFVGRKYSQEKGFLSLEYQEITKLGIPFHNLETGRSNHNFFKLITGLYQAEKILSQEVPDLIISFGGYLGFPICLGALLKTTPVYIHEQTTNPGQANRLTSQFAKKIFVSFPQAAKFFPQSKTIISGNPLRPDVFKIIKQPFVLKRDRPVIYITGGSLGAHSINLLIEKILPELKKRYYIIHQTGNVQEFQDFKRLSQYKDNYYFPVEHFSSDEIGAVFAMSNLIISRSGANTYFELIALGKPAILIPLPWSAKNEQQQQAELLQKAGRGEIFNQKNPPEKLLTLINQTIDNVQQYKNNINKLPKNNHSNAVKIIHQTIQQEFC